MKKLFCWALILFHCSCFDGNNNLQKIDALEERVKKLEEKLDTIPTPGSVPLGINDLNSSAYTGNCQAITKKGRQCKRKAKSNGYCWQHSK